jgi:hypothetical protein
MDQSPIVLFIFAVVVLSVAVIAWFSYHAHYESRMNTHRLEFVARVLLCYISTLVVAALILIVLNHFPLWSDPKTAINSMIVVAAPASAAATVVDALK